MNEPTPASASALSRALVRAERGVTLNAVEAETLLHARGLGEGEPPDRLLTQEAPRAGAFPLFRFSALPLFRYSRV